VQRCIELKPSRPFEGRGISAGDAVLFQNKRLESLPGERRGAAQTSQASADDDSVPLIFGCGCLPPLWQRIPVKSENRNSSQHRFKKVPSYDFSFGHAFLLPMDFVFY
jgi:hypothetical protein